MSSEGAVEALGEGVWRISQALPGLGLVFNCYLLEGQYSWCLVDAGPASVGGGLVRALSGVIKPSDIGTIILLDDSPFAHSALPAWRKAGFHGVVIADLRVAKALGQSGFGSDLRWINDIESRVFPGDRRELKILRPARPTGRFFLFKESGAFLFSGQPGSSLPVPGSGTELGGQLRFRDQWGYGAGPALKDRIPAIGLLCPRFGSTLPPELAVPALKLADDADAPASVTTPAAISGSPHVITPDAAGIPGSCDTPDSRDYELKEIMITSIDSALRDPVSGMYTRTYADSFIHSLLLKGSDFSAAFVRIDRIKDLNRRIGAGEVDVLLGDFAKILSEIETEGFLFRWTGPAFLLILEGEGPSIFRRLEILLKAIAEEKRFAIPITASVAIVRSSELGDDALPQLQALSRERLKLLERRGGNAILDRSDPVFDERPFVMVMDADSLFLDYLVESFTREGFHAIGAARGGRALELMDETRPELVIVDRSLPQFDAFQIRTRMKASSDLHDIPFILLTLGKNDEMVIQAHSLDIYHVFEKPVSIVELIGIAKSLLSRSEDGA